MARPARLAWIGILVLTVPGPIAYGSAYLWARTTHRLVNCGSFIAGRCLGGPGGIDPLELVFLPAIWAEERGRQLLGR